MSQVNVLVAASQSREFQLLNSTLSDLGMRVVAATASRSLRPNRPADDFFRRHVADLLSVVPGHVDLLLPSGANGLAAGLAGYHLDLMVVFGFNWRLPPALLAKPTHGVLNIHLSALPQYRGPAPVLWAIRNGDRSLGATVHRMDEGFDTGPVLAQARDIAIPDEPTPDNLWPGIAEAVPPLLAEAVERAVAGEAGTPQDEARATPAGFAPDDWRTIDRDDLRERIHDQVRVLNYMSGGTGVRVAVDGRTLIVERSSLGPVPGQRIECRDGPLWLVVRSGEAG